MSDRRMRSSTDEYNEWDAVDDRQYKSLPAAIQQLQPLLWQLLVMFASMLRVLKMPQ